jgi:quinol monooxygenase YgiN
MAVTVLITREFKKASLPRALESIVKIRSLATLEPGYISGQTMVSLNNANRIVVMSTWESIGRWEDWQASELRKEYTAKLDPLTVSLEQVDVLMVLV